MIDLAGPFRRRLFEGARDFGLARWIIVGFVIADWLVAVVFTTLNLGTLVGDCLVRSGMNGVLVLALVLPVRAGNGLNFGIPLGIVSGLVGGIVVIELAAPTPFGIQGLSGVASSLEEATGFGSAATRFTLAHLVAIPLAAALGYAYGWLLERVRGQEMMVGIYVGFGAVAAMCVIWLSVPVTSTELILPIGGKGVRQTVLLDEHYKWVLDGAGEVQFGSWEESQLADDGPPPPFSRPEGLYVPTGLLLYWLGACGLLALFLRTRMGTAMSAVGANPLYARSIGIRVSRMRVRATMLSTVLAAMGILVYSQSYGFFQLYKAPLWMAFPTVAALLLGGASLRRANIFHVIVGTLLFQSLLTTSLPVVNDLVQNSQYRVGLANLPEIARLFIQNGIIIYALAQIVRRGE